MVDNRLPRKHDCFIHWFDVFDSISYEILWSEETFFFLCKESTVSAAEFKLLVSLYTDYPRNKLLSSQQTLDGRVHIWDGTGRDEMRRNGMEREG